MHAILLDALGTLVKLEPPAPRLATQLQSRFGIAISEAVAREAIAAEIRFYRAHLDLGRDKASLQALRSRCAEAMRGALPAAFDRIENRDLTEALLASLQFTAFPDALESLPAWRAAGARLVVVSNWDASLHEVLARLSLADCLDAILTSAEFGARKPAPEIFDRALALVGARPSEAVHIGDSPAEDVAGARAAGIEPVLVVRERSPSAAEPLQGVRAISSLTEFDP